MIKAAKTVPVLRVSASEVTDPVGVYRLLEGFNKEILSEKTDSKVSSK